MRSVGSGLLGIPRVVTGGTDDLGRAVASTLAERGWTTASRPSGDVLRVTGTHPTPTPLVVGLSVVGHRFGRPAGTAVSAEAGVAYEPALDLAVHLGLAADHAVFTARHPDRAPQRTTTHAHRDADLVAWVAATADDAVTTLVDRYDSVVALLETLAVFPRLLPTDLVVHQVLVLAATHRSDDAVRLLARAVTDAPTGDRRASGWVELATRFRERLTDWIARGEPQPPPWHRPGPA